MSNWTCAWPPLFISNINSLLLSNWAPWDNREMVWKNAEPIFQRRFYGSRCCRIVRSLVLLLKRQKFDVYLILSLHKHSYVIWCQYIQDWLFSALWINKNMCPVNTDDDLSMATYQTLINNYWMRLSIIKSSWHVRRLAQLSSSEWVWINQHPDVLSVCFRRIERLKIVFETNFDPHMQRTKLINKKFVR